jgi:hypothetical protein
MSSDKIKRYLDEHGATYTPEALRKGLLDAGYDPAEVDSALQAWQAERTGPQPDAEGRRTFSRWALWLHVAAVVAVFVLLVALKGTNSIGLALLGCAVLSVALLIGWAISSFIGRMLLPGTGAVVALIVPAISALALGGSCFALMSSAIGTPPRDGTVHLEILEPRAFEGDGSAFCYVASGNAGVEVSSQELGTLDGKTVSVSISWYGADSNVPKPADGTSMYVMLNTASPTGRPEFYGTIFSTRFEVDAAADNLSGTIRFEGLVPEPMEAPEGKTPRPTNLDPISGSVSWACE